MNASDPRPPSKSPALRLRVSPTAESIIRSGHPWLFANSIREQNRPGATGELAVVFDRNDRFLAVGFYDADSPIRVRLLHAGKPVQLTPAWWEDRLRAALARRRGLFDAQTTGWRMIHGENDGWPGLVLDRYDRTLVLKLYSAVWLPRLPEVLMTFRSVLGECSSEPNADPHASFDSLVLRLSRNIQSVARTQFALQDGQLLQGALAANPVEFLESGLRFEADVIQGQKTGFFLDQRENRRLVETHARSRTVLNAFSFSGAFSIYAARGGAASVTDLDISAHALASSQRHWSRNFEGRPGMPTHETIQADAFDWLASPHQRAFDLVIVDPPSLAKREVEKAAAIKAYGRLAENAAHRLNPGGVLVAASCSAHVTADEFFQAVRQGVARSGRAFQELQTTRHPADHAATFPEAEYLKCIHLTLPPRSP